MNASLRTLLTSIIDYAGLFPPAQLPLDQAIRNYARYRQEPDTWMLGRFVIPATRLDELEAFADLFSVESPLHLSLLGRGGEDLVQFVEGVGADCDEAEAFGNQVAGRVSVDVCELRAPPECNFRCIGLIADMLARWTFFVEAGSRTGNDEEPLLVTLSKAAQLKANRAAAYPMASVGFKLRCGGLEESAFPTVDQVAFVLRVCRDAGLPLKFTAGLHHPIRRFDAGVQTHMHGFVNVFVAGVLAHARRLDEEALRAVIADEDAGHFQFTDDGLSWKTLHVSTAEVADARRDFVTSFGSCSFDEPRDDLRALGWL